MKAVKYDHPPEVVLAIIDRVPKENLKNYLDTPFIFYTAQYYAALNKNTQVLKLLIDKGADVNQMLLNRHQVLDWCFRSLPNPCLGVLLDKGADLRLSSLKFYEEGKNHLELEFRRQYA